MTAALPLLALAGLAHADDYCRRCARLLVVGDVEVHGDGDAWRSTCEAAAEHEAAERRRDAQEARR